MCSMVRVMFTIHIFIITCKCVCVVYKCIMLDFPMITYSSSRI